MTFFNMVMFIFGVTTTIVYLLYRTIRPKPLPGVPYNPGSAERLLGDLPEVLKLQKTDKDIFQLLGQWCHKLNTPIMQVFLRPGARPWVIVADPQEEYDIMTRRTAEFERSSFFADLFRAFIPSFQGALPSDDQWKHQRRLVAETMAPSFIQNVNGPAMYTSFTETMSLWRAKAESAKGRPFGIEQDVTYAMLDAIWAAAFGHSAGCIKAQPTSLSTIGTPSRGVVEFSSSPPPPEAQALLDFAESSELVITSPLGYWHTKFAVTFYPRFRAANRQKTKFCRAKMLEAQQRLAEVKDDNSSKIKSASDLIISRAMRAAAKEGRNLDINSASIHHELYGYLLGGHETVETTISWGIGFTSRNQTAQQKLRGALYEAHSTARHEKRAPTATEIAQTSIPYLDAYVEEVVRLAQTAPTNIRITTQDTDILGYSIPKGTEVFMLNDGPGVVTKPINAQVKDSHRTATSRENASKFGKFDPPSIHKFHPERWLKHHGTELVFSSNAGPILGFGVGSRACFGKRLAYLEMRMFFTLFLWNFELLHDATEMRAKQMLSRKPETLYVNLRAL